MLINCKLINHYEVISLCVALFHYEVISFNDIRLRRIKLISLMKFAFGK